MSVMDRLRPTLREETGTHLTYLDGWRGLAIAVVLAGHFGVDRLIGGFSGTGVELFFVLSGRLMAEILFVRKVRLPVFFFRRFSRVYPALAFYVVAVTVCFHGTKYAHGFIAAASALTFSMNYAMIYGHMVGLLAHLWSLCVEEHSYCALALMAALVGRRSRPAVMILLFCATVGILNGSVRADLLHQSFMESWRTDVRMSSIVLAAGLYLARHRLAWLVTAPAFSPLALALGLGVRLFAPYEVLRFGLGTTLLALAVVSLDEAPLLKLMLRWPPLRWMGLLSFSMYLWQQPFYQMHADGILPTPVLVILALSAALVSFFFVEKPCRLALNRAQARWNATTPVSHEERLVPS